MTIERFANGSFGKAWQPAAAPRTPGVYRITIYDMSHPWLIYIGESSRVAARLCQHAQGRKTISVEIRKALAAGHVVHVDTVFKARLQLGGEPFAMDMRRLFHRRLIENAAIVDESDSPRAEQVLTMNSGDDNDFWLTVHGIGSSAALSE